MTQENLELSQVREFGHSTPHSVIQVDLQLVYIKRDGMEQSPGRVIARTTPTDTAFMKGFARTGLNMMTAISAKIWVGYL